METLMLAPLALAAAGYYVVTDTAHGFASGTQISLLLTAAGVVTAVPLLMFATAARRMSLTAMGFCQYLAPSITFCLGVFVYGEPMNAARLASFALIWVSIAIFSVDALAMLRRARQPV
jgi:chloramphenicol-sensitive protein RarD